MLIVCEDSHTAPNYFNAHIEKLNLPGSIKVRATGQSDPTPDKVVEYGLQWLQEQESQVGFGNHYTTLFIVIDRDEHPTFMKALNQIHSVAQTYEKPGNKTQIKIFPSFPCFEIWFLFHYERTRSPYVGTGGQSPADMVVRALKKLPIFKNYNKSDSNHYKLLESAQKIGYINAKLAKTDASKTGEPNPSTEVHELMIYLDNLRNKIAQKRQASGRFNST